MSMGPSVLKNNLTNPARVYLWEVLIPNPIGGGDANALNVRCQSAALPGRSVGEINVPYKQTAGVKYPGKLKMDQTWELTFVEGEDKKIFDAIHAWNKKVVDEYEGTGAGDELIKQDITLRLLDTKGNTYQSIKLVGCYPQAVGNVDLSYDAEDTIKYPVTFSYDYWESD